MRAHAAAGNLFNAHTPEPLPAISRTRYGLDAAAGLLRRQPLQRIGQVGMSRRQPPQQQRDPEADQGAAGQCQLQTRGHDRACWRAVAPMNRGSGLPAAIRRIHTKVAT